MTQQVKHYDINPFRVLVSGYINLNVIDGSAFFLSGVAGMLGQSTGVVTTLLSANKLTKFEVVDELEYLPAVEVLDPFESGLSQKVGSVDENTLTRHEYALAIKELSDNYDAIMLRDTETAAKLIEIDPAIASKLAVYVTGIAFGDAQIDTRTVAQLNQLNESKVKFLCQTEDIRKYLVEIVGDVPEQRLALLKPHVPDPEGTFDELYHFADHPDRYVYTGKFFKAWNTDRILAAFKAAAHEGKVLHLDIAGDQFRHDPIDRAFVANNRWLMDSTPNVNWVGRVPRARSRELIKGAHCGIGWRAPQLDNSLELSTKLLEYGALARPSIVNRTPLHEELLGADYPLFANSMSEFKNLLNRVGKNPKILEQAAARCYDVAVLHGYRATRGPLLEFLGNRSDNFPGGESQVWVGSLEELWSKGCPRVVDGSRSPVTVWGDLIGVGNPDESRPTVSESIDRLRTDIVARSMVPKLVRDYLDAILPKTSHNTADTETEPAVISVPKSANESYQTQAIRLENEKRELQARLTHSEQRLQALRSSRLGSMQIRIWKVRQAQHQLPIPDRYSGVLPYFLRITSLARRVKKNFGKSS